jgi:hypothetical protein
VVTDKSGVRKNYCEFRYANTNNSALIFHPPYIKTGF